MLKIKERIQSALGIPQLRERLIALIVDEGITIRGAIYDAVRNSKKKPILACVTILCHREGTDEAVTMGAEDWVTPGHSQRIPIEAQLPLRGRFTFFVSGDPNLVVTGFSIGNSSLMANMAGCKYGEVSGTIGFGQRIIVVVEHRVDGQCL
jgi:hypothetical protein